MKGYALNTPLYEPKPELRYDGAVVLLVDQNSASAGEYFPQFREYHDHALVVGEHTSGGAGGPLRITPTVSMLAACPDTSFGGNS